MPEITLEVPSEDQTKETLYAYCNQKRDRSIELRPNSEWDSVEETGEYIASEVSLDKYGTMSIIENIPRQAFTAMDAKQFYQLFRPSSSCTEIALYGYDIIPLIDLFREAERDLGQYDEGKLMFDPELIIETRLIHLCEFALEYDYGVGLSQ